MDGGELMARSLADYELTVRQTALLVNQDNFSQAYDWLVKQLAYHHYKEDLDRDWDNRIYQESLAKSAWREAADGRLARRETITTKEGNCHE
jgi:hypothetical protein